ncbi:hypothetical protein GCK72_004859 [Caenorhabditis remanei]|uniref:Uncharacterized protein n=1 Tax=Caenorhabditis remanei TaxID=31234 RepID=A0A6A5HAV9_CAERE|nr:hypothetical protein GCK72_004859 [Caenorhabditis remanei]KAF1764908.1 hypothetical protein GCK72_004859 [Caenorhabditis remanei]
MTICKLLLLCTVFGAVAATWSMSGYACNQPQLYSQCNCPSFCSSYMQQPQYSPCGYSNGCSGGGGGYYPRRRHHHRKHKKPRRKFRFDSDEDEDMALPPRKQVSRVLSEEQGFIEEKSSRVTSGGGASGKTDSSWENEDLWEKKFVTERTRTTPEEKLDSEEFPEITSEEIAESERRMRMRTSTMPPQVVQPQPQPMGGGGLGGLGLGNGGLFGISSGVGVGVPGVGPIGVSSGLGIGK